MNLRYFNSSTSKIEVLKYLAYLPNADLVFQIAATVSGGNALWAANQLKKPILQMFIGSDVLQVTTDIKNKKFDPKLLKSKFISNAPWLCAEAQAVQIQAPYVKDLFVDAQATPSPLPKKFEVLTYCLEKNTDLYGLDWVTACAKKFPDINFNIAGLRTDYPVDSPNIKCLGWLSTFTEEFAKASVFLRLTKHDGVSHSVIEALASGRWVIRTNDLPHTFFVRSIGETIDKLQQLKNLHENGELDINRAGYDWVAKEYSLKEVTKNLTGAIRAAATS
jgi:hypothetical protein